MQEEVNMSLHLYKIRDFPRLFHWFQEDMFCNAALSGDVGTVQNLLGQGINVNCSQQGGWTALMNATLQGHAQVVDTLIRSGANLDIKDLGGFTALMYAASYRRYPIAEALVKAGANLDITDNAGRNIHQYAQTDPQVKEAITKGQAAQRVQPTTGLGGGGGGGGAFPTGFPPVSGSSFQSGFPSSVPTGTQGYGAYGGGYQGGFR